DRAGLRPLHRGDVRARERRRGRARVAPRPARPREEGGRVTPLPRTARAAAGVLGLALACAAFAPLFGGASPTRIDLFGRLRRPAAAHPLGTDELGRDVLSRLVHGASISLGVAGAAVALSAVFGSALGLFAGEKGGLFDAAVGRLVDLVLAFPGLLLAVAL